MIDPPTDDELVEAARLREELDGARSKGELSGLADALRAAHQPMQLTPEQNAALLARALLAQRASRARTPRRSIVARVAFGASVALSAAAVFVLVLRTTATHAPDSWSEARNDAVPSLGAYALSRTTASLFREPSSALSGSGRIDRIALARSSDFRENRYRAWGVR